MLVLGIETSCDETAAAIVEDNHTIWSNVILSQHQHRVYGGVVPEIGARAHLDSLSQVVAQAMADAGKTFQEMDAVAATCGPGLIGGVMVGAMMGKAIAFSHQKPFLAINHLEAHGLTPRLTNDIPFPYLLLLASGGHCQLLVVKDVGVYQRLGSTIDDAVGEAFDKVAKMLNIPYPGGPKLEELAKTGNRSRFNFPRPLCTKPGCDFSFSGLKTAVARQIALLGENLSEEDKRDLCASFQTTVGDVLVNRTRNAIKNLAGSAISHLVVSGGVAANLYIGDRLRDLSESYGFSFTAPPVKYCTDNAAMVAWAGVEKLKKGLIDGLDFAPRPRWPLA